MHPRSRAKQSPAMSIQPSAPRSHYTRVCWRDCICSPLLFAMPSRTLLFPLSLVPRWTLLFSTAISAPAPQGALCSFPMHFSHSRCLKLNFVPPSLSTEGGRLTVLLLLAKVSARAAADQQNQPALLRRSVTYFRLRPRQSRTRW